MLSCAWSCGDVVQLNIGPFLWFVVDSETDFGPVFYF